MTGEAISDGDEADCRFFVTYTGVKMPFRLVEAIPAEQLNHRNTFIRAYFDGAGQLTGFDKMVYGEVELAHRYAYHANGALRRAEVSMVDEDTVVVAFDEAGAPLATA
ncbi:DUF6156 family protein [Xanthobacter autotrophicus DSM 431]|uniref:DUF6156 family protein n=1 Tax=Xanthobacter nonsaccharivorans TaxID=3119912 RepID=UPI00372A96FC